MVTASHRSPGTLTTTRGDIFALGSSFYEIMTGQAPYTRRKEEEIAGLFSKSRFPEIINLGPVGNVIQRCWQSKCASAYEVWTNVKGFNTTNIHLFTVIIAPFELRNLPVSPMVQLTLPSAHS